MTRLPGIFAPLDEIMDRARILRGKTINDILPHNVLIDKRNKGLIGNVIEEFGFGIKNNSVAGPDFISAEVELKVIPIKKASQGWVVKERTKVCAINYRTLPSESWNTSHARLKLRRILFIYYVQKDNVLESIITDFLLYELDKDDQFLKLDWQKVTNYVKNGNAHLLSEGLTNYLAASRTGSGGLDQYGKPKDLVPQYNDMLPLALRRAFSLKPTYTTSIYQEQVLNKEFTPLNKMTLDATGEIIPFIINKINEYQGINLKEFAKLHGLTFKNGKAKSAQLIRSSLGLVGNHEKVLEFNRLGIKFKTVPVHPNSMKPYEAMSFPVLPFSQVVDEDFWASDLVNQLSNIIVITLIREKRTVRGDDEVIGKTLHINLTNSELDLVKEEYDAYRRFFSKLHYKAQLEGASKAQEYWKNNFIQASKTHIIHMRPHTTKNNYDDSLGKIHKVKHSFWLNKKFIQNKILQPTLIDENFF